MQRGVLAELFLVDSLRKLTPGIIKIMNRHLALIKKRAQEKAQAGDDFVEISLKEDMQTVFRDIVSYILFGEDAPKVGSVSVSDQVEGLVGGFFMHFTTDFWHKLTGGWSTKLGLSSEYNRIKGIQEAVYEGIRKVINHRKNSKDYVPGLNILDIMITHNKKMEEKGRQTKSSP